MAHERRSHGALRAAISNFEHIASDCAEAGLVGAQRTLALSNITRGLVASDWAADLFDKADMKPPVKIETANVTLMTDLWDIEPRIDSASLNFAGDAVLQISPPRPAMGGQLLHPVDLIDGQAGNNRLGRPLKPMMNPMATRFLSGCGLRLPQSTSDELDEVDFVRAAERRTETAQSATPYSGLNEVLVLDKVIMSVPQFVSPADLEPSGSAAWARDTAIRALETRAPENLVGWVRDVSIQVIDRDTDDFPSQSYEVLLWSTKPEARPRFRALYHELLAPGPQPLDSEPLRRELITPDVDTIESISQAACLALKTALS